MYVNGEPVEWLVEGSGSNIQMCMLPPCESHLCQNGATCEVNSEADLGYMCVCSQGLTGEADILVHTYLVTNTMLLANRSLELVS